MTDQRSKSVQGGTLGRRGFWRSLAGEVLGFSEELRGIAQQSLRDIDSVPDSVLAEMIPTWMEGQPPEIRDDGIYIPEGKGRDGHATVKLVHSLGAHEKLMVDQYACGRNLRVIAEHVAQVSGMDSGAAFAATRTLFVRLCQRGLCHPAAAHV